MIVFAEWAYQKYLGVVEVQAVADYDENADELPLEEKFVEQAEYMDTKNFLEWTTEHPNEEQILKKLCSGGAKLLVGPRGCGKTTLMLKAFYSTAKDSSQTIFPIYVNFKLSLKIEPLYLNTPNAGFWFRAWLSLKIYEAVYKSKDELEFCALPPSIPPLKEVIRMLAAIEAGKLGSQIDDKLYNVEGLGASISDIIDLNGYTRCILFLDDAAHAFSPRQQEDFFDFYRQIKSKEISPKAAIYPGITNHSPNFHVGHDAEQIDAWLRPDDSVYLKFMRDLAEKRFDGVLPKTLNDSPEYLDLLAYASFGIPRAFLNMLRLVYHYDEKRRGHKESVPRLRIFEIVKEGRRLSHAVYDSLAYKLPAYKLFIDSGQNIYQKIVSNIKNFNKSKEIFDHGVEVGIKRPISPELRKVIGFFQYAGLLMSSGETSRGIKGVFEVYKLHYGDLITENAVVGKRTKTVRLFLTVFKSSAHQAWPRVSPETLADPDDFSSMFRLTLPNCQNCGAERLNENAKFCHNCGAALKSASIYDELVNQDIGILPISKRMVRRIKEESSIRKIKDILIDSDRTNLRSVKHIGPARATRIASAAEEYVA